MKKVFLKILDVLLTIIMVGSALYATFNLVMSFLPSEIQATVFGALHMSSEYVTASSISATINAAILVATKVIQTYSRIKLTAKLDEAERVNVNMVSATESVVERANALINNINVLQVLTNALLSVQEVTTERNIKASDKLIYTEEKEKYKKALEEIRQAREVLEQIKNLTTVYEKTEIKEVVVEKEQDALSGRV